MNNFCRVGLGFGSAFVMLGAGGAAQAMYLEAGPPIDFMDGNPPQGTVFDTRTNLEWLTLLETRGTSPFLALTSERVSAGFGVATEGQILELYRSLVENPSAAAPDGQGRTVLELIRGTVGSSSPCDLFPKSLILFGMSQEFFGPRG